MTPFPGTCDGGIFTYEKTTGHFLRTGIQEPLSTDSSAPGITNECAGLCMDDGSDCPAFSVDYAGQRCFKLDRNTQVMFVFYCLRIGVCIVNKTTFWLREKLV